MKVSIIIPIYQAEKYLKDCLDSILNQTYKNIEVILVDDGSKDNSLAICNHYKEKDERVVIISQENGGVSAARNTVINNATWDYI
ncbi:MAG: glycosyltransferase [Clostridia bacterium]|nr:glycosyltransferase [Clostridia bacterium]